MINSILQIPAPVLSGVFKHLDKKGLLNARLACRTFSHLASQNLKQNYRNLHERGIGAVTFAAEQFFCRITQRRLYDAVAIIPCGCRVNLEAVAKVRVIPGKFYQEATDKAFCPHPSCLEPMLGWKQDFKTREATEVTRCINIKIDRHVAV